MLGELAPIEVDELLYANVIARIGCHAFGKTYVVPITYLYDGNAIYARTLEGMKLHMMRQNPHVCFEVDSMDGMANWKSVIASGLFQELHGAEAQERFKWLSEGLGSRLDGPPGASNDGFSMV